MRPTPTWDHDHCWQKFCDTEHDGRDGTQSLTAGYGVHGPGTLPPEQQRECYYWICPTCFNDFKDYFGWTVETGQ
jgi:hypothetical protein